MNATLRSLLLRLAFCLAVTWLSWRFLGRVGMATAAPSYALLARPLMGLFGGGLRRLRERAQAGIQGHYYAYRGKPVQVLEDARRVRWVRAADVRAILGWRASDNALALTYGEAFRAMGPQGEPHFEVEALRTHLSRDKGERAHKFGLWVEREVALPARNVRKRWGIRAP